MKCIRIILITIVAIYLAINSLIWHMLGASAIHSAPGTLQEVQQNAFLYVAFVNEFAHMLQWLNFSILIPFGVFGYFIIIRNKIEIASLKEEMRQLKSDQPDDVPRPHLSISDIP